METDKHGEANERIFATYVYKRQRILKITRKRYKREETEACILRASVSKNVITPL
jgi:hypothetical protein